LDWGEGLQLRGFVEV